MKRRFSIVLVVAMIQVVCVSTSFAAPIHDAAERGDIAEVTRLIDENPANVDAADEFNQTPLYNAAVRGHTDIVQALLDRGADVNIANDLSYTPLHKAAMNGHTATVQVLIALKTTSIH